MKISYEVEVGETFQPPVRNLAPSNYDANKHDVFFVGSLSTEPKWLSGYNYHLELKKFVTKQYAALTHRGSSVLVRNVEHGFNYPWGGGKKTVFVLEYVYEDQLLIDIIVHKSPKG